MLLNSIVKLCVIYILDKYLQQLSMEEQSKSRLHPVPTRLMKVGQMVYIPAQSMNTLISIRKVDNNNVMLALKVPITYILHVRLRNSYIATCTYLIQYVIHTYIHVRIYTQKKIRTYLINYRKCYTYVSIHYTGHF